MFNIIFVDVNAEFCHELNKRLGGKEGVPIIQGRFQDVQEWDCIVSPGNSYGIMDGGMDYHLSHFFGTDLQRNVQKHIIEHYAGLQPVGTSFLAETGLSAHPYVAHTPTMRYPMMINGTINVYLAMKAMLLAVKAHNESADGTYIESVICPGLGTGAGRMPHSAAAYQMALAYEHVHSPPELIDWGQVHKWENNWKEA